MSSEVKLIMGSYEPGKELNLDNIEEFNKFNFEFAGKAAGVCYMPDDYFDNAANDSEKCLKRANGVANSGHYSVFEHTHVTLLLKTPKIIAMILNNSSLYTTSEKSARYTKMHAATEYERDLYGKWLGIFTKLISAYNKYGLSDKQVEKLAMENARYLTSVFTETTMLFTVPYGRLLILPAMLDDIKHMIQRDQLDEQLMFTANDKVASFYSKVIDELNSIIGGINKIIGCNNLINVKKVSNDFFVESKFVRYGIYDRSKIDNYIKEYKIGDQYKCCYKATFAELAQAQRHRTLHYSISFTSVDNKYIPVILQNTPYESEWIKDMDLLLDNGIIPQGIMVNTVETGSFEDFIKKCNERICSRAQLEIHRVTKMQLDDFYKAKHNLSEFNIAALNDIANKDTRCRFNNYSCIEPCNLEKELRCRLF